MAWGEKGKPARSGATAMETLLGPRVEIRGDLRFSGGLYVEGRVFGSVVAEDDADAVVTLAASGRIQGEVRAPVVVIAGEMEGDVHASQRLELAAGARVTGNLHYKVLEMAAGAAVSGRLVHAEAPPAQLPKPEAGDAG
jgi:cytoskeletal protein CcmA (bactofilin family)